MASCKEGKPTDAEILRALEIHTSDDDECLDCVFKEDNDCLWNIISNAYGLVIRQRIENDSLRIANEKMYTAFREQEKTIEAIFSELESEITAALENNYKAKGDRLKKPNLYMTDELVAYCEGKIHALRGISDFIEELKEKYTEGQK